VLLEMAFIFTPKINVVSSCEKPKFFLRPVGLKGQPKRFVVVVSADESQIDGTVFDIDEPRGPRRGSVSGDG